MSDVNGKGRQSRRAGVSQVPPVIDGRYRVLSELGRGGMGVVVLAEHLVLRRRVAVKLLPPERVEDAGARARFRTEAEALARLEHPRVVRITDFGVDESAGDLPYLVMEHLEGGSLRELLDAEGRLPAEVALPMMRQLAEALDFGHANGVVHGDLKPENVFLVEGPNGDTTVKLLDLGLARFLADPSEDETEEAVPSSPGTAVGDTTTRTADELGDGIAGTAAYLAPELRVGARPTPGSDVYALGVMAFEALVGRRPAPCMAQSPPAELPAAAAVVLKGALAPVRDRRPPTAGDFVDALSTAELDHRRSQWSRRERPRRAVAAVALAALALTTAWLLSDTPILRALETRVLDLQLLASRPLPPDERLLMVAVDDAWLDAEPAALVDQGDTVGELLARTLEAGAAGVGIDILLPAQWGHQAGFVQLLVEHGDRVVLAAQSTGGRVVGPEAVAGLITVALGPERSAGLFGIANLEPDRDGILRWFRPGIQGTDGSMLPSFGARLAEVLERAAPPRRLPIDGRTDTRQMQRISLAELESELEASPERFAGRLVVLGLEYSGSGDGPYRLSRPAALPAELSGLRLQALLVDNLINDERLRPAGPLPIMAVGAACALAVGWALLWPMGWRARLAVLVLAPAALVVIATATFQVADRWLPLAAPLTAVAGVTVLAALLALRLPARPERA